jgi:hypothetical protein
MTVAQPGHTGLRSSFQFSRKTGRAALYQGAQLCGGSKRFCDPLRCTVPTWRCGVRSVKADQRKKGRRKHGDQAVCCGTGSRGSRASVA